jgi:hypothetical protein
MADLDVISDILTATLAAYPDSEFVQSISHQYLVLGGLSKKQMQGLYKKAERVSSIPPGKLATLEAEILKRPNRYKSVKPPNEPLYIKDERIGGLLDDILAKYPQHKRVVFFKGKFDNNETLSQSEITELERFHKLLLKK